MKKSLLVSGASKVDPNEIYRNDFNDVSNLIISTDGGGTVTSEDPIGTVVLPRQALTIDYPVNGKNYATVDLGQTYDELYIQFYVSVVKTNQTSGYDEFCQIGSTDSGGLEVTEMKYLNSTVGVRPAAYPLPSALISEGKRIAKGEIFRVGVHINKSTLEGKYYFNGKLSGQVTINDRDLRYITLGGTNDSGTKVQFSNLTVNTNNFSKGVNTPAKIGQVITAYIDPSMDASIDASNFSGMHNAPYDPDGGTNYIDGPVRYTTDLSAIYFQVDGKSKGIVRIKDGTNVKLKDFSDLQRILFGTGSTDVDNNYLVTSYSGGNVANYQAPTIDTSITLDPSVWSVHDASNNIYVANLGYSLSRLKRVWYDEQLGLRTSPTLADLSTNLGLFFKDGTDLYVRLWDDSNPSTHSIDIGSNVGFSIQDFCTMRNVTKRIGGMSGATNAIIEYCDFTLGSSISVANNSIVQYSHFYNNWAGGIYPEQQFNDQETPGITVNSYGIAHANTVEDSYIGIRVIYGTKKPLVCFNVVKNIIVNHIAMEGSVNPHTRR